MMGQMSHTFFIIDGQPLVRRGMALLLQSQFPGSTTLEAPGIDAALLMIDEAQGTPFSLVLLDLDTLAGDRLAAVSMLSARLGRTPLVVMSADSEGDAAVAAVRAGARGYVLKSGSSDILGRVLALALAGAVPGSGAAYVAMPRTAFTAALAGVRGATLPAEAVSNAGEDVAPLTEKLTERQQDIFRLILAGCSNKEIARELGVLEGTVKVHVRAVMQKLGAKNRTQVAVAAARSGLTLSLIGLKVAS